jgi:hypothetical protein
METLLVYPENNKQLKALKAVMATLNVKFEKKGRIALRPRVC